MPYSGGNYTLASKNWTGTDLQAWEGEHVMVQYYSKIAGSSDHYQHGDLSHHQVPRRLPHMWVEGEFNQFGFDASGHYAEPLLARPICFCGYAVQGRGCGRAI